MNLDERAYNDVGEGHRKDQQNREEISPGELQRSGTCNSITVYIYTMCHLKHRRRVRRSGENDLG